MLVSELQDRIKIRPDSPRAATTHLDERETRRRSRLEEEEEDSPRSSIGLLSTVVLATMLGIASALAWQYSGAKQWVLGFWSPAIAGLTSPSPHNDYILLILGGIVKLTAGLPRRRRNNRGVAHSCGVPA